jgi:hypothetical protein
MAYIGLEPSNSFVSLKRQVITGNGGASYTLDHSVASVNDVAIFVNNVRQDPAGYSISGTALTLGGTIESSDDCYVIFLGQALQTVTPDSDTITTAMLKSNAVDLTSKVTGTLPVANGGTNLSSGFANGITMVDQFRLTANLTNPGSANITANLERVDDASFSKMGTGMTESSGVFTFPSTGLYRIQAIGLFHIASGNDGAAELVTSVSSDSGSNYDVMAMAISGNLSGSQSYNTHSSEAFVNVTNASTFRAKFETGSFAACTLVGNTDYNQTSFSFIRLGDSQ